uniref:Cell division cycle protein 123 n=1 Tax=Spongospora subterranea TaxID=70186 RepID=A0A0H5RCI9_9EUKA|eukprot:CRZ11292.1 hypothetical protein [Spongospora subterranea]
MDPIPTARQVLNCQIHEWYPRHRRWTIRSDIIDLSRAFLEYLNEDAFFLPPGARDSLHADDDDADSDASWSSDSVSAEETRADPFPEVDLIRNSINKLNGAVFPKLNWSCPRDATWIACTGTLKCVTPGDVLLLLKASEFIQHDLTQPFETCSDDGHPADSIQYKLCLRQWVDIQTSREFRCFIIRRALAAVSQRDHANFYPSLQDDGVIDRIRLAIQEFFTARVLDNFPDDDFVMDVYIGPDNMVVLIDFNPFSLVTDSLLFDWPELYDMKANLDETQVLAEFRICHEQPAMTPASTMSYGFPKDITHVRSAADIDRFAAMASTLSQVDDDNNI